MAGRSFQWGNSSGIKGLDLSLYSVVRLSAHSSTQTNLWERTQGSVYLHWLPQSIKYFTVIFHPGSTHMCHATQQTWCQWLTKC